MPGEALEGLPQVGGHGDYAGAPALGRELLVVFTGALDDELRARAEVAVGPVEGSDLRHAEARLAAEEDEVLGGATRGDAGVDVARETVGVELQPDGEDPIPLDDDLLLIPTPGHTRGSACLLWRGVLFTGDTLAWDTDADAPYAFDDACWYDWGVLLDSLRRLLVHDLAWIVPGHGAPGHAPAGEVRRKLTTYLATEPPPFQWTPSNRNQPPSS